MDDDMADDEVPEVEESSTQEGVYSDEGREDLVEDDEISAEEEGFMEGAEDNGQHAKCANCGKAIKKQNTIEKEIDGDIKWFCSEHCVDKYEEKAKEEKEG
ncbi:hypothetical protein COV19_03355 [Candidatus Woesearchaeota archaeon CG10_big_fil_rev_8_21_14_0_10_44_13]|nr:MAG: hypothetical protein COV19_03355 [Candidatus Woesearchaeota archaeon CG10_big_fil_rev_8_21_14_0_10_44_13]